mmetsp:Transcript_31259/g.66080  ORF Transcript_31259/g.66080 Transcript_31259/m.66080 type:complete len:505 (+) Transcript_31259:120-1634(+)
MSPPRSSNDDDEEFEFGDETNASRSTLNDGKDGATSPSNAVVSTQPTSQSSSADESVVFSPELLGMYYSRLFPYHLLYSWLAYDPSSLNPWKKGASSSSSTSSSLLFSHREFSMTIEPQPGNEVYIRYQSFPSQVELTSAIIKRRPTKIDIGAVFNHPPKDKNAVSNLQTIQRELVFDIDLTDYDGVRNCGCEGAKICNKCWKFMGMAVEVMDQGLREDFGFEHIAWFYSGRRGVHCWVCDEQARTLTNEARSAVASYFEVNLGSDKNQNFHITHPLHPMLSRAYKTLEPHFINDVLPEEGHGLLATQASWIKVLVTLPKAADPVSRKLKEKWERSKDNTTPHQKWTELKSQLDNFIGKGNKNSKVPKNVSNTDRLRIEHWPIETVFKYTYPRLDINVSKMQNHLLKSPFCVHPKTGRVCVPINISKIDSFDPFAVPTLNQLMKELDEYGATDQTQTCEFDWQKTSLKAPFENFQKQFLIPLMNSLRRVQRVEREKQAAAVGDF